MYSLYNYVSVAIVMNIRYL